MDWFFHLLYIIVWPYFRLIHPVRAVGRENIPEGPVVVCPNHTTAGDPFYVVFAFGYRWPMRAMAKVQIMRLPFIGWILGKAGVFGVDRDTTDVKAVRTAMKFLKEGDKLLIFPEGTRVRKDEDVDAKVGAALFATRTGTPLLPVYIQRKKRRFRRNTVVIGKPYYPEYENRRPSAEELQVIARDLMERVRLLGEGVG
ncbi:MAG: 1-acyl-sn-glycerol-3-phosphate acyltransferase [Lawsonibacter sp.]|nr:1-acyl-sn-glycerol-3-phosphate acyltransferase [Lawsonibacter sp.]